MSAIGSDSEPAAKETKQCVPSAVQMLWQTSGANAEKNSMGDAKLQYLTALPLGAQAENWHAMTRPKLTPKGIHEHTPKHKQNETLRRTKRSIAPYFVIERFAITKYAKTRGFAGVPTRLRPNCPTHTLQKSVARTVFAESPPGMLFKNNPVKVYVTKSPTIGIVPL